MITYHNFTSQLHIMIAYNNNIHNNIHNYIHKYIHNYIHNDFLVALYTNRCVPRMLFPAVRTVTVQYPSIPGRFVVRVDSVGGRVTHTSLCQLFMLITVFIVHAYYCIHCSSFMPGGAIGLLKTCMINMMLMLRGSVGILYIDIIIIHTYIHTIIYMLLALLCVYKCMQ